MRATRMLTAVALLSVLAAAAAKAQETRPPVMAHPAEGRANCLMCHSGSMPNVAAVPASHQGWENTVCTWCHAPDAAMQRVSPPQIPHPLEGRANCMMCHTGSMPNVPGAPADHEGRTNDKCGLCHKTGS